ncbi:aminotransferase class I/II-fold pyridoxal phosphate-dependent enzyme [Mesorhizobium sp. BAC0120]|uniref:trans-sulfuration enzyme family protein n=1 Tax=Mesorhizobium sp. BAC0120 TaxID=3090670 RepID=UPI00298BF559|nr:aminotransferase class I/II-fold pyridoxal phosphate-dependent enzyme [Mesorhizobium sp. BAC0120]MDW6023374.1 aminotransferase class I/II-fold pyridoxal phosphate-dependent enzyme [Mesorhizobium sp. BAC0120]
MSAGAGDRIGTRAVHSGFEPAENLGAVTPPIYQSATFLSADTAELEAINEGKKRGFVYSRVRNPTVLAAEQRLAALEEAESAVLFASGMAAVAGALAPLLSAGDELVALPDIYGGSIRYFNEMLPRQGVTVHWAASPAPQDVAACITEKTKVVYAETPTNPLVRVVDLAALSALAREAGALLVVDGTLGGPMNQRPLELGADLVIHSATKYLNGHGDVLAGAVAGSRKLTRSIRTLQQASGAVIDPNAAWLLMRGMATYPLRMAQHNLGGIEVARFLAAHPKVTKVHYPGLPEHPDHELARQQMSGFGGLLSFELADAAHARHVVDATRLFGIGPSIGGVESLISQPGNTSHHSVTAERRREMGISDGLVRVSVGIETIEDLIADLAQALEGCR